jgi:hypothetical protein
MQKCAERQVEAGVYADLPAAMRALTEAGDATGFRQLQRDLVDAASEPSISVDLRASLLEAG